MKDTKITELPIIPGNSGNYFHSPIQLSQDMTREERTFINDLITYYEPKSIIEIGVAEGGGSFNILKTIYDTKATLTSIDRIEQFRRPPLIEESYPIGNVAIEAFPDYLEGRWRLITGKDPSEVIELLNTEYDFCILDTRHIHPVESLNFLTIFPFLSENAIVVLHDTTLYASASTFFGAENILKNLATRYLMCAIAADKLIPDVPRHWGAPNIVAMQLSSDTRKYLRSVFDMLLVPWDFYNKEDVDSVFAFVKRHYPERYVLLFKQALEVQTRLRRIRKAIKDERLYLLDLIDVLPEGLCNLDFLKDNSIFYGAGQKMRALMNSISLSRLDFNFTIWDIDAERIGEVEGYKVTLPDLETLAAHGQAMIITIEDEKIAAEVRKQFEPLGYRVFHGLKEYVMSCG